MTRPRLDKPYSLWVQPTRTCNMSCRLCYDDCPESRDDELSFEEITNLLDEAFANGVISVFFEGGEPFMRPDFMDIVRYATPHAFVMVRTHGTLITPEIAKELGEAKVGTVCINILGATPETHDGLTGVPGSHAKALAAAREVVGQGIETFLLCIMTRQNAGELQGILDLTAEVGAHKMGVLRLYPIGRARQSWEQFALSLEEQEAALAGLVAPEGVTLMQSWHPNDPNCCWQLSAVDAYGNSIGCPYLRELVNYGNIRETPYMETWDHGLYRHLRTAEIDGACPECAESQGGPGGCRSTAYSFTGDWDAPDPFCKTTNNGIDLRIITDELKFKPTGPAPLSPEPELEGELR